MPVKAQQPQAKQPPAKPDNAALAKLKEQSPYKDQQIASLAGQLKKAGHVPDFNQLAIRKSQASEVAARAKTKAAEAAARHHRTKHALPAARRAIMHATVPQQLMLAEARNLAGSSQDAQRQPRAISAAAQEMLQNREANQRVRWPFNHLGGRPERDGADRQAESTATQQEMPTMPNQSPSREQRQREKKGCELQAEHRLTRKCPATPKSRAWQRCRETVHVSANSCE